MREERNFFVKVTGFLILRGQHAPSTGRAVQISARSHQRIAYGRGQFHNPKSMQTRTYYHKIRGIDQNECSFRQNAIQMNGIFRKDKRLNNMMDDYASNSATQFHGWVSNTGKQSVI